MALSTQITMKQLLESGVHFGHQTRRWNPKMKKYIYTERNGIHIIDLRKTLELAKKALEYVADAAAEGKIILFVGTKKQAQESIKEAAEKCGMPYVNFRWLGGTLTNFATIRKSIERYKELEEILNDEMRISEYPKKEQVKMRKKYEKMKRVLEGIRDMEELPDVVYINDPVYEEIALKEAKKLGIPVVAIADTNCDPDLIDVPIPGNDDAIRALKLFNLKIAEAIIEGMSRREEYVEEKDEEIIEIGNEESSAEKEEPSVSKITEIEEEGEEV